MKLTAHDLAQLELVSPPEARSIRVIAIEAGLKPKTLEARIYRGMSLEEAIARPVMTMAEAGAMAHKNRRKKKCI